MIIIIISVTKSIKCYWSVATFIYSSCYFLSPEWQKNLTSTHCYSVMRSKIQMTCTQTLPTCFVIFCNCWKNSGDPWLSPPSDCIGSTITPATGSLFFFCCSNRSATYNNEHIKLVVNCTEFINILHKRILKLMLLHKNNIICNV